VDVRIDQVMLRSDGGPVSPPLPSGAPLDHVEACPAPPPIADAGVQDAGPPPCYDGTDITCGEPEPQCPSGLYAAIQNHCWVCVDRKTCQAPDAG
jgi:hypothetical protein